MKALRSLSRYDHRRSAPQTWLLRIAKNAVTDHLRALRRRGSLHVSLDRVPDLVSSAPSQEERLLREERLQRVFNGLSAVEGGRPGNPLAAVWRGARKQGNRRFAGHYAERGRCTDSQGLGEAQGAGPGRAAPEEGNPMTRRQKEDCDVPCPPGIEALDRELREIVIEERSSLGPELRAELVEENRRLNSLGVASDPALGSPDGWRRLPCLSSWPNAGRASSAGVPGVAVHIPGRTRAVGCGTDRGSSGRGESGRVGEGRRNCHACDRCISPSCDAARPVGPSGCSACRSGGIPRASSARGYRWNREGAGVGGSCRTHGEPRGRRLSGVVQLDEAAVRATRSLRFVPATRGGEPVGTWVEFSIEFRPERARDQPDPQSQALHIPLSN